MHYLLVLKYLEESPRSNVVDEQVSLMHHYYW